MTASRHDALDFLNILDSFSIEYLEYISGWAKEWEVLGLWEEMRKGPQ